MPIAPAIEVGLIVLKFRSGESLKRNHHFSAVNLTVRASGQPGHCERSEAISLKRSHEGDWFQNLIKVDDYEGEACHTFYVVA
jgi:hypothetical protein